MCGIVGYIGPREITHHVILACLKRLEYRGYDSAGIAVLSEDGFEIRRSLGKLKKLEELIAMDSLKGKAGLGHTRWATHGRPSEINAHPHQAGEVVVVHNGIIENYLAIKEELQAAGHTFKSETDTEVLSHLIQNYLFEGLGFVEAVRSALRRVQGSYAIGVMCRREPGILIGARKESPLIVGLGDEGHFIASDIPAVLDHTRRMVFLDDEEMAILGPGDIRFLNLAGREIHKKEHWIDWSPVMAEKGGFKHFMQKEIFEQPRAIIDTFRGRVVPETGEVAWEHFSLAPGDMATLRRVAIVACGTSFHAALVGKFTIEHLCRMPVEVDLASEFRYREPIVGPDTLLILISQSGETADTLAALREGEEKGAHTLAICNVVESSIVRGCRDVIYTHAGPEIGVASTKAFVTQLTALYLLAIYLGRVQGRLDKDISRRMIQDLICIPHQVESILEASASIREIARDYMHFTDFLYLGRGINYPIALEGALKLKEISYIHAEGYPAGEMKHGPIALIDEDVPTIMLATRNSTYSKVVSNIEEIRARRGKIIAVVNEGDRDLEGKVDTIIPIPVNNHLLTPIILTVPLQLLAYYIADLKGTDVDQPRNLAKSVTVE
ncbi:MAG: glutamine--fructose-6-phosphate transaminase (isomerizing) [Deltaproteobacteria bacterium]|nr:glutamine--fructose-6-phosphate transaminase (isomerizing) [Deltaproteobacteria bacterium]